MSHDLLCCPPPAECDNEDLTTDSFDKEIEKIVGGDFHWDLQLPTPLDELPIIRGSTPSLVSPSQYTFSTESTEVSAAPEHPSATHSTSNYPLPLDVDFFGVDLGSVDSGVDPKHNTVFSDPSACLGPFGTTQLSPVLSPYIHVVKAQSDDGPYRPPVGISPHILIAGFQSLAPAVPTDPPICAASNTQIFTGPIRTKFTCRLCGFESKSERKHNHEKHMETHSTNRIKPFVCSIRDCGRPFTRSNDLKRHLKSMHGVREK